MNAQSFQHAWDALQRAVQPTITSLVQISWQALWLSLAVILLVGLLQICRVLPRDAYSRWRLSLLLTATIIPFLLSLWTWLSGHFENGHYNTPYLWQNMHPNVRALNPAPEGLTVSIAVERCVLGAYCAWLVLYPVFLFFKTSPMRRFLKRHDDHEPFWIKTAESLWQRDLWNDLVDRFYYWRPVRVIEVEEAAPMTVGFFNPVVVVPDGITGDSIGMNEPERFRAVLAHELAHVRYHSVWALIHRFAVWFFPLPQLPVWLFNWMRKRVLRLQMDTAQASGFIGDHAAAQLETVHGLSLWSRLWRAVERMVQPIPDPAGLVDVEFELHADFAAVRRGAADPVVLKETLLNALLYGSQHEQLTRDIERIKSQNDLNRVLDRIKNSDGFFGVQHGRFMEFPQDKGISLWTKVWKTAASLLIVHPVAIAVIPALIFLAKTGSELITPPAPGFVHTVAKPTETVVVSAPKVANPPIPPPAPPPKVVVKDTPRKQRRPVRETVPVVAKIPAPRPTQPGPTISPPPAFRPQSPVTPVSRSVQDSSRQIAAANERQRIQHENLVRQSQATESMRRQAEQSARTSQAMESGRRTQNQFQAVERARQMNLNVQRTTAQNQQSIQRADAGTRLSNQQIRRGQHINTLAQQSVRNDQRQMAFNQQAIQSTRFNNQTLTQQRTMNTAGAASYAAGQNVRLNQQALNSTRQASYTQPRHYTPAASTYTPPPHRYTSPIINSYTPTRTYETPRTYAPAYTPPPQPYNPPRIYNPPPIYNPPRIYSPPPPPYVPPQPPRFR